MTARTTPHPVHQHRTRRTAISGLALALAVVLSLGALGTMIPPSAAAPAAADSECFGKAATIVGTPGDDRIRGTNGDDVIVAGRGDDRINGRGGDDLICGRSGDDRIRGGGGDDKVRGWRGEDSVKGGPGDDRLLGGLHNDTLRGNGGDDLLDGGAAQDDCDGGAGANTLVHCEVTQNTAPTDLTLAPSTVAENQPAGTSVGTLTATDPDAGDTHTFTLVAGAGSADNGSFTIVGAQLRTAVLLDFETTPTRSVRVRATDSGGLSFEKALTITVTNADDPPVAVDDTLTVVEDDPATAIDVLANDTDTDGGPKSVASVTQPTHGTVLITGGGTGLTYAPAANYCNTPTPPTDDFTYTLNGVGGGVGDVGAVAVTVTCVNDAADAVNDAATVAEDSGATVINVLANDSDAESDPFSVTAVTQPAQGAVTFTPTNVSYTPALNDCTTPPPLESFTYTITGGDTATVTVTVTCVNDAPVAVDDTKAATEDTPLTFPASDLTGNDTDPDAGDTLTVTAVSGDVGGTANLSAGSITFTPTANLCLPTPAGFDYTVSDGTATDTGHVTVNVTCVNDPAVAVDDTRVVNEDASSTGFLVLTNDTDVEGDPFSIVSVTDPANGSVTFNATSVAYTPDPDYCNTPSSPPDTFDYTITGGDSATVSVTVTCVNDAPVVDLDSGAAGTGSASTFNETNPHTGTGVLVAPNATVTDVDDANIESLTVVLTNRPDGDALESLSATLSAGITGSYNPATGTLALTGSATKAAYAAVIASIRYDNTANPPNPANRIITVVVSDGDVDSATATATVQVVPLNSTPDVDLDTGTAGNDSTASFVENGPAVTVAPAPAITDTDDTNMEGATVVLTARPDGNGQESLTFTIPGGSGISAGAGYDAATGTLTFNGTSSNANYATLLGSIQYANSSDTPTTTARSVTFTVNDGLADSVVRTATVSVTAANDAPTVDLDSTQGGTGSAATFTEDGAAASLATNAAVADVDSANLASATITLTNRPDGAAESLAVTIPGGNPITSSGYNSGTGVLTLTGPATPLQFETVIKSLTYANSDQDPDATARSVTVTVNDGTADSNLATATVTVTPVNDAPSVDLNGAAGGIDSNAAFTEDSAPANPGSGPAALAPTADVTDVDNANLSGATITLTNHPDGAAESLSVNTAGTSVVAAAYNSTTGVLALSGSASKAQYQQVIRTLAYNNTSNTPGTANRDVTVMVTDPGPLNSVVAHATVTVTPTNDAPVAVDDTFNGADSAVGNTPLAVGITQAEPRKALDCTVPDNCTVLARGVDDSDPDGPGPLIVGPTGAQAITTADGGKVTLEADGNFTYFPDANSPSCTDTSDSFTYTLNDQGTNGTDTATVTIAVTGCVWYLDSSVAGPGTGTGSDPFKALTGVNVTATDADGAGDTIMILDAASYAGGLPLENNQLLRSKRAGLTVSGSTIVTAGGASNPTITNAAGIALTLASGNTIQGIDLGTTPAGNTALSGSGVGTATMNTVTSGAINNTTGGAVDLSTGTLAMAFTSVSSSGATGDGIRLDNAAGTFTASGGSLQNAGGQDVDLSGNDTSDDVAFTYDGTITDDQGQLVNVSGQSGGTKDFNGAITDGDDGDGSGIALSTNTGATVRFDGGLTLSTGGNAAFAATEGGTVMVTDPNANGVAPDNTLSTTTAAALNVANTTIGAAGLTFRSISSSGGTSAGIILDTTGSSGGLTVTGDGSNTSLGGNGSGGTIANKSGADGSTTSGIGIYLNSTSNVTLRRMTINGTNQNFGIRGFSVTNLILEYSTIGGTNGTSVAGQGEGSVYFGNDITAGPTGLLGSATVTNVSVSGGRSSNFSVSNTSGTLNRLTINNSTFGLNVVTGGVAVANDSFTIQTRNSGTVANVTVTNSTFTGAPGDLMEFVGRDQTTMDVVATGNTLTNSHPDNIIGGGGMTIASQGVMTFNVQNNSMRDANGSAVTLFKAGALAGTPSLSGTFSNNTIGATGVVDSGSKTGNGIFVSAGGTGTMSYTIRNNQIHQIHGNGHIYADNTGGSYTANFTIEGNLLDGAQPPNWFAGIAITNGSPTSGDTINVCADIGSAGGGAANTLNLGGNLGVIVGSSGAAAGHTFRLPGVTTTSESTIESGLAAANAGAFTVDAYVDAPATFGNFTGTGTTCPTP